MRKSQAIIAVFVLAALCAASAGYAVPAFARKTGFNCAMCHTAFPKLNDFGQRYRDDGYQLLGLEGSEKTVFDGTVPLALRTSPGVFGAQTKRGDASDATAGFNVAGLDLLAAGVLHKNISVLVVYTPRLDLPSSDFGGADGSNPSQLGSLESANVVFSNLLPRYLNLRAGRFEPAYLAVSPRRSYYLVLPYEIYDFTGPGTNAGLSTFYYGDNQLGLEATGRAPFGLKYALGVVNGTGGLPDNNVNKDLYLNLFQVFGRGDGMSAGQGLGVFAYYGWQPTLASLYISPWGEGNGTDSKPVYRLGGDLSLNWETLNLRALYLRGFEDQAFNLTAPTEDYEFSGGLAEVDWATLPNNKLVASVLYNWVQPPSSDEGRKVSSYGGLVRYYLGDWKAVNVALHGEYAYRVTGVHGPTQDNLFAGVIDVAF